jgi:hypothetical protein
MTDPKSTEVDNAAEIIGSKIFGAFKARPKAFRLFAEITNQSLRLKALTTAWRCTIEGTAAEARYRLEVAAEGHRQKPTRDTADDFADAAYVASQKGVVSSAVCDVILKQLRRNSSEWRESLKTVSADVEPARTELSRKMESIRSQIASQG